MKLLSSVDDVNAQYCLDRPASEATNMSWVELCKDGDLEGVKAALQSGADVNTKDKIGETGLMGALRNKHNLVVELLLKTPNIDVNQKSDRGLCALHMALWKKLHLADVSKLSIEALKLLLDVPNIDVNCVNNDGWSAVHVAVNIGNNKGLKLLLNVPNINVNIVNNYGDSALHRAVKQGNTEGLKLLLSHPSIDVNILDKSGFGALHWAVVEKNIEGLKLLLDVPNIGGDIVDKSGRNVLHVAVEKDNIEGLKLLLSHPNLTALALNQENKRDGATPVMLAVMNGSYRWQHLELLAADPRVDLDTTDVKGRSLEEVAR